MSPATTTGYTGALLWPTTATTVGITPHSLTSTAHAATWQPAGCAASIDWGGEGTSECSTRQYNDLSSQLDKHASSSQHLLYDRQLQSQGCVTVKSCYMMQPVLLVTCSAVELVTCC
jgi:hypothetical protein